MNPSPGDKADALAWQPRFVPAFDLGLLAAIGVAIAYGLASELFGLTWGLIAVGVGGGLVIGGAVTRGAWSARPHITVRRLQVIAAGLAIGSWITGVFLAYVVSQALIPQATTPLADRLSFGGFSDYFSGLFDSIRFIHAASVAAMAFAAWRNAR